MNDQYKHHVLTKKAEHRPFDFDQYYNQVKDETFKSFILPVDPPTANAMVNYYQQRYNSRKGALKRADVNKLRILHSSIAHEMEETFGGKPVFCRMTNRSPKDGEPAGHIDLLQRYYHQELDALSGIEGDDCCFEDANLKMVAASAAQLRSLRCTCADDVMNLLLSSERVFVDTLLALDCRRAEETNDGDNYNNNEQSSWSTYLILREWDDGIGGGEWEFRVFVHEDRLTAVSQYNHYCVFPCLMAIDEKKLLDEIVQYWTSVAHKVSANSYVMDIVKLNTDDPSWKIIELNPLATTTGAALFDWNTDREIILSLTGSRTVERSEKPKLRIRHECFEGLDEYLQVVMLPAILSDEKEARRVGSGPWTSFLRVEEDDNGHWLSEGRNIMQCALL